MKPATDRLQHEEGEDAGGMGPSALDEVEQLARRHYENFPVLSLFLPLELRSAFASLYAFARVTDDLGDTPGEPPAARLARLDVWERRFDGALTNGVENGAIDPVLAGVVATIRTRRLDPTPFRQLIDANRIDQQRSRYATYEELLDYCSYSANPVGRIVLALFGRGEETLWAESDAICTALQLANHWQGIAEDLRLRDRLYVPLEDLERFGVSERDLRLGRPSRSVKRLLAFEIDRARALLESGAALPEAFPRSPRAVLRLFVHGGRAILFELERRQADVLRERIRVPRRRALLALAYETVSWVRANPDADGDLRLIRSQTPARAARARPRPAAREEGAREPRDAGDRRPGPEPDELVSLGYRQASRVVRERAGNFYFAFLGQPRRARRALHALYAFCREADDIVDDGRRSTDASRDLTSLRDRLERIYAGDPDLPRDRALRDAVVHYEMPRDAFLTLLSGVERDLTTRRYATFEDLYRYCFEVAASVGLLCLPVFGRRDPLARRHAVDLGIGMQLVNILRDLAEDGRRGRIYLPQSDLAHFGVREVELLSAQREPRGAPSAAVEALLRFETRRARRFLESGKRLLPLLAGPDRFCPAALSAIYEELLSRIDSRGGHVLNERVSVSSRRKMWIAGRTFLDSRVRAGKGAESVC